LKGQSETKSPVKPMWIEKMATLSTFLKSSLNFLSIDIKNTTKSSKIRDKSGVIV